MYNIVKTNLFGRISHSDFGTKKKGFWMQIMVYNLTSVLGTADKRIDGYFSALAPSRLGVVPQSFRYPRFVSRT